MFDRISFIWLYVRDLEASVQFYKKVMGLTPSAVWDEGASFLLGDVVLGLHKEDGPVTRGNSPVITFHVQTTIEEASSILQMRGAHFIEGVSTKPYGKTALLQDPDGHMLLLHQPSETEEKGNTRPTM